MTEASDLSNRQHVPAGRPRTDWRSFVLGSIAWGWVLYIGSLYLDAHPWRFDLWNRTSGWSGVWHFPGFALGGVLLVAAVSTIAWIAGRTAGARIDLWRNESGESAIAFLGGIALIAMGVFALGVVHFLVPIALVLLLLFLGMTGYFLSPLRPRWKLFLPSFSGGSGFRGSAIPPAIVGGIALLISLLAALSPAVQSDGMRYHLFGPQEYLRSGHIGYIPFSAFTNFPFLVEMLFTLGLGLGTDTAAKALHWVFLPASAILVMALVRRMTAPNSKMGTCAAVLGGALFLATPVAAIVAGWSFIDMGIVGFFLAMVWSMVRWISGGQKKSDLLAAGFFAGAAIGTKYTMLLPAALAAGWIFLSVAPHWKDRFIRILLFALVGSLCAAPWFIKNTILTGNPVYPLGYSVFGGGDWSEEAAQFYSEKAAEKGTQRGGIADFVAAPFDTAIYWVQFESQNPGPGYLLGFPFLIGWLVLTLRRGGKGDDSETRRRRTAILVVTVFAVFTGVTFFAGYKSNRFLLPVLGLTAALLGALIADAKPIEKGWKGIQGLLRVHTAIGIALLLSALYGAHWTARYLVAEQSPSPIPVTLGFMDTESYRTRALNYYPATQWLAVHSREGERAFYIGEFRGYPSAIPIAVSDWFDTPLFAAGMRETPDNDALLNELRLEGYRYILFNEGELRQYAGLYLRPRLQPGEWERLESLLKSPRLRPQFQEQGVWVFEILPDGSRNP